MQKNLEQNCNFRSYDKVVLERIIQLSSLYIYIYMFVCEYWREKFILFANESNKNGFYSSKVDSHMNINDDGPATAVTVEGRANSPVVV